MKCNWCENEVKELEGGLCNVCLEKGVTTTDEAESEVRVEAKVMQKIAEETEQKLLWLDNLLCTIHRDGGHFIEENGYQKAYDKAMDKIISWLPIT